MSETIKNQVDADKEESVNAAKNLAARPAERADEASDTDVEWHPSTVGFLARVLGRENPILQGGREQLALNVFEFQRADFIAKKMRADMSDRTARQKYLAAAQEWSAAIDRGEVGAPAFLFESKNED